MTTLPSSTRLRQAAVAMVCGFAASWAVATPPSAESIERLITLTRSEAMVESMYAALEPAIRQGMQAAVAGKPMTPDQQRFVETVPARLAAVMRSELTWASMKGPIVQIYLDTFDQNEVDGLIAFYSSPVGQSMIAKMPAVMQRSMQIGQAQMQAVLPRLMNEMKSALAEAKLD